jgi:hypothetical protein
MGVRGGKGGASSQPVLIMQPQAMQQARRVGGRRGRGGEAGEQQIRAPGNPYSSFSSSSSLLCIRRGFDKKFCFLAAPYNFYLVFSYFMTILTLNNNNVQGTLHMSKFYVVTKVQNHPSSVQYIQYCTVYA